MPGTAFVIVKRNALNTAHPRNLYLNIRSYIEQQDKQGTPFTQSVQTFYALNEALDELFDEGGQAQRLKIYQRRMGKVREALSVQQVKALLPLAECSSVLHAYELPSGISYEKLHGSLKASGFIIYAGQGELAKSLFRISMMGEISDDDTGRLIQAFTSVLA